MMRRAGLAGMLLAVALLASACGRRAPDGQIVAIVDGEDITTHDLERLESRLPAGTRIDAELRNQLVSALIDGRLAAQEAKREGFRKTPEYLDASREANDAILIDLLNRHVATTVQPPSPADVDRYLESHASRFTDRQIVRLDQVRFTRSAAAMKAIANVSTLAAAEAALQTAGIPFQRSIVTVDTLALTDELERELLGLSPNKLLGDRQGTVVSLSQVVSRTPMPVAAKDARDAASALIARDRAREALGAMHQRLRQSAKVSYQKGFAPPPATARK